MEDLIAADQAVKELQSSQDELIPADVADAILNNPDDWDGLTSS